MFFRRKETNQRGRIGQQYSFCLKCNFTNDALYSVEAHPQKKNNFLLIFLFGVVTMFLKPYSSFNI